jgi:hypothetical protein
MNLIQPYEVLSVWPKVRPLIQKAIDTEAGPHLSAEDVLNQLIYGKQQLWLGEHAAIVTELQTFPQCKSLVLTFCGGDNINTWFQDAYAKIESWARLMECDEVLVVGRPGWEAMFKDFKKIHVTLRLALKEK